MTSNQTAGSGSLQLLKKCLNVVVSYNKNIFEVFSIDCMIFIYNEHLFEVSSID